MSRPALRTALLLLSAVLLFAGLNLFQARVLEPRRQELLGYRSPLPRALLHAAEFSSARAGGQEPRFVPGEIQLGLSELPARMAAFSLGGLRGFFTIYLWMEAEEEKNQKIHEDLLDKYYRIAMLQPDYPSVWSFHAWNLSYNLSVQWSTPERRYEWVRHGIDFLAEGIRRNPQSVTLLERMGDIYFQKIAANNILVDRRYFSEQVRKDDGTSPYLMAYQWYDLARRVQDETGNADAVLSRQIIHSQPCHALNAYAKELTQQTLELATEAAQDQIAGRREEARQKLRAAQETCDKALGLWNATVIEWLKQRERFPDDYNADLFGRGAQTARQILLGQKPYLTAEYLAAEPEHLLVRVKSAQSVDLLARPYYYQLPFPGAVYGPIKQ
jgi:hypothetical protein